MKAGKRYVLGSILSLFILGFALLSPQKTYAYFEARYFCLVKKAQITVTLQKTDKLCMTYVQETSQRLEELSKNIIAAQNHIRLKQDVVYRQGVLTSLQKENKTLQLLKDKLLVAVDDFERDLFRKIHALVRYQLKGDREKVFSRQEEATNQALQAKNKGDVYEFVRATQKVEYYQKRVALLDHINFAQSFEEMMPFLKDYLGIERLQLSVPTTTTSGSVVTTTPR